MLEGIPLGLLLFDATGHLRQHNANAANLLEVSDRLLDQHPAAQEICHWLNSTPTHDCRHLTSVTPGGRQLEVTRYNLPDGGWLCTLSDVSGNLQVEAERQRLYQLLTQMQAIARVGGWESDFERRRVVWTEGVYRILEISPQEYRPTPDTVERFLTPQALATVRASFARETRAIEHDYEIEMVTAHGRHIWVRVMGNTTWNAVSGKPRKRISTVQDVTERVNAHAALRASEQRWKLALESSGDGVWDWNLRSGARYSSPRLREMLGYSPEDPIDETQVDDLTHPDDLAQLQADRQAHLESRNATFVNEHRVRCRDGSWKWVLSRGLVIERDPLGQPLRMIGTFTDITARREAADMVWREAHLDALTQLPNRRLLRERLESELIRAGRDHKQLALLFIDLDHFKEVNDSLGHPSGDALLREAARRIRRCIGSRDTAARMGGDEFTVILTEIDSQRRLERVLNDILQALQMVFQLDGEQAFVSASIGIAMSPTDGEQPEELLRHADQALYVAKGQGRNRYSFYTSALQEAAQTRMRLSNDLRVALAQQQLHVVYQPIVDLLDNSVHKAEILLRWAHPTRGAIGPAEFIPLAESSGLIVSIGNWVFEQALLQVQRWRQHLHPEFQISINKSPVQFQHAQPAGESWGDRLHATGLPGSCMVVEITEGLLMDKSALIMQRVLELHDSNIEVSLDDFGTGYSSLAYLQRFDIDYIKIDRSFVRHLVADSTDLALCKAIIAMAHTLNMKVVAEGVETTEQLDLLRTAGCDYAQGYLFSHPVPANDFEAYCAGLARPTPS